MQNVCMDGRMHASTLLPQLWLNSSQKGMYTRDEPLDSHETLEAGQAISCMPEGSQIEHMHRGIHHHHCCDLCAAWHGMLSTLMAELGSSSTMVYTLKGGLKLYVLLHGRRLCQRRTQHSCRPETIL